MKTKLLIPIIMLLFACGTGTLSDPKVILKKASEKCQGIQNGYYEMTKYFKVMTDKDTLKSTYTCHFKKLGKDTLFSKAFHNKGILDTSSNVDQLYTGNELVWMNIRDSTAEITSCAKWASDISSYTHNYYFYSPLTEKKGIRLSNDTDFTKPSNTYKLIGLEKINNIETYHVQINEKRKKDEDLDLQTIRAEYHYWIQKSDFMPIQYSTIFDVVMDKDTMSQYEKIVLDKYEINNLKDETPLQLASIPAFYKKKDYVPYVETPLLPKDTIAPNWELLSMMDKKVSLKDLKGQVVLIDFFYRSCYPCMQALPALQSLSEKYKNKGLKVIGIDPYDTKADGIVDFLSTRGVSYTVLLGGEATANQYRVSGYPTMYIIDKKGKIVTSQVGYGKGAENELEEIIRKNL